MTHIIPSTVCSNEECLSADLCKRFTHPKGKHQSTVYFLPGEKDRCGYYLANDKGETYDILSNRGPYEEDAEPAKRKNIQAIGRQFRPTKPIILLDSCSGIHVPYNSHYTRTIIDKETK